MGGGYVQTHGSHKYLFPYGTEKDKKVTAIGLCKRSNVEEHIDEF